jgi:hypothetical protein
MEPTLLAWHPSQEDFLLQTLHLLAQVTALYESAPFMLLTDLALFEIPIEARQLQSKSTLQSF